MCEFLVPRGRRPPVQIPAAGGRERFTACLADIRLLPRMRPHMHSQVAGLREGLAARLAHPRLLPRMRSHVPGQGA
jgi:hypothetical protein